MSTLRRLYVRAGASDESWIHSASSRGIILLSAFAGFVVCGTAAMWAWLAAREGWAVLPMALVSDAVAGVLAAVFLYTVLRNIRQRRLAMLQRLAAIAEINHEIRNALDLIQLSAYTTHHQQAIGIITDAVNRIQATLREMAGPVEVTPSAPGRDQE